MDGRRVDTGITPADLAGILWGSDSDAASDVPPSATAPSGQDVEADIDSVDVADADLAGAAWGSESDADADGSSSDVGPNADDVENAWDTDEEILHSIYILNAHAEVVASTGLLTK